VEPKKPSAAPAPRSREAIPAPAQHQRQASAAPAVADGLTAPQQKIIDAIAQLELFGINAPNKLMVAAHSRVSPRSSGYANNLGRLRNALGLIEYPNVGTVALTGAGRAQANKPTRAPTLREIHESFLSVLSAPQAAILAAVIDVYPRALPKDDLAERINVSKLSSGYANNLGSLRTLGAIDYPEKGMVRATDILFPQTR
jgi:hypothetical protein